MVVQINPEINDTVFTAANAAVKVATILGINVLFYWDRLPYEATPGANAQILAETVQKKVAERAAEPKAGS